ncbi:MAG: hypothetical protein ACRDRJ_12015, partial [Streptosporangiaceae bacterium]
PPAGAAGPDSGPGPGDLARGGLAIPAGSPSAGDPHAGPGSQSSDRADRHTTPSSHSSDRAHQTQAAGDDVFWALHGLQQRVGEPGAVLFTGTVALPGGAYCEWQEGRLAGDLLDGDWSESSPGLTALAHPVRLLLLREVLHGTQTAAQLSAHPRLGTSGQLYHHLRLLVSAGWLRSSARGQYDVPADRVVPLLTILAATR